MVENSDQDLSFLEIDKDLEAIILKPLDPHEIGIYDQIYLHFYLPEFPERSMIVEILATIEECKVSYIWFSATAVAKDYNMGDQAFTMDIPSLISSPNCGTEPVKENLVISSIDVPKGAEMSELVSLDLDNEQIKVEYSTNLTFVGQKLSFKLSADLR